MRREGKYWLIPSLAIWVPISIMSLCALAIVMFLGLALVGSFLVFLPLLGLDLLGAGSILGGMACIILGLLILGAVAGSFYEALRKNRPDLNQHTAALITVLVGLATCLSALLFYLWGFCTTGSFT